MKILVINGSPKQGKSNTMNITRAFLSGFPKDAEVTVRDIYKMNVKPCMGCFSCWTKTAGRCVLRDDMGEMYELINDSDIIIESFPLYFFGMPSQMKAFVDRCLPFMLPYMGNKAERRGESFHELRDENMHSKSLVVISSCGYVDSGAMYPALVKQLDLICGKGNYTHIFCPEGELFIAERAHRQREAYLKDIAQAGAEFALNRTLCAETKEKLAKPMLSPRGFEAITLAHRRLGL